jgi:LPXTG-motif cell wall-anchored protein
VTGIPSGATPVQFGPISVSVDPDPDVETNTCANPKVDGNVATCVLTINSSVPGVFTANATATITMGGTAIVRSTDVTVAPAGPGGSGPAIKTYEAPPPEVQGVQFLPRTGDFLMKNLWAGALLALLGAYLSRFRRRQV